MIKLLNQLFSFVCVFLLPTYIAKVRGAVGGGYPIIVPYGKWTTESVVHRFTGARQVLLTAPSSVYIYIYKLDRVPAKGGPRKRLACRLHGNVILNLHDAEPGGRRHSACLFGQHQFVGLLQCEYEHEYHSSFLLGFRYGRGRTD